MYDGMACVEINRGNKRGSQYDGIVTKKSLITMKDGTVSTRMSSLFNKKMEYLINVNIGHLLKLSNLTYDSFSIGIKLFELYENDVLSKCTKNNIDSVIIPLDMAISTNWYLKNGESQIQILQTLICILTDVIKAIRSHEKLYKMKEIMLVAKTPQYVQALQTVIPMFFDNFTLLNQ